MAFNLPTPQNLHTSGAGNNRGEIGSLNTGTKGGGNLPITTDASQVTNNTASSVTGNSAGVFFGMDGYTSTNGYDATQEARVLLWSLQYNAPNRIQSSDLVNGGSRFWLGSGSDPKTAYKEFFIGGNDTPFCSSQSGPVTMCIDISDTSNDNIIGAFDPTDITAYAHGSVRTDIVGSSNLQSYFQRSFLFTTTKGSANLPTFTGVSDFDDAVLAVQGTNYTNKIGLWLTKSGVSFFVPCPFSFGNGVDSISFNDNGVSVVSPASNSQNQENFRITNDAMRVYLDTRDNVADIVVLSGSYAWGTAAKWDFDISNNSNCQLAGNFSGMGDFKMGSSVTATGLFNLFTGKKVICNGANIDSIIVNGSLDVEGSNTTSFNEITVTGVMNFDTPGTYTLTNSVVNELTNLSGGTVIININNTTITTNNGPNITIVLPLRNISVTGLVAGSRLCVYNQNTSAQVFNQVVAGTSYTAQYAEGVGYSIGDVLELKVAKINMLEFSTSVVVTPTGWNGLISQDANAIYNAHGVDGATVTGISWDSGNMEFDFNDSDNNINGADIGAWYYYFITTEIGIAEAFGALVWSQINKITNATSKVAITFDNVKSSPLQINNCWIDRNDGISIIAPTSNSIQIAPLAVFSTSIADVASIKAKTDLLNFTGTDLKATLDGETVTTDTASREASKATTTVASNMRGTEGANTVVPTTPPTVAEIRAGFVADDFKATTTISSNMRGTDGAITSVSGLSTFDASIDEVITDSSSRNASKADVSSIETKTQADARQLALISKHNQTQTDILNLNNFDPDTDVVANVTLVDATTVNTDMRGTDGANTVVPTNETLTEVQNTKLMSLDTDNLDAAVSTRATKADADQALVDYNVDTKTNVKPSIPV